MSKIHLINKPSQVRQGDVLVTPVERPIDESDIGKLLIDKKNKRVVLALGEATGHWHGYDLTQIEDKLVENPVQLFELSNADKYISGFDRSLPNIQEVINSCKLLRLNTRALLRHEEHDGISEPAFDYIITPQYEGNELEEIRRVAD